MGADSRRQSKGRRRGGGNNKKNYGSKKERFGNANDIPLGPRPSLIERGKDGEQGGGGGDGLPKLLQGGGGGREDGRKGGKFKKWDKDGKKNGKVEIEFNPNSKKSQEEKKEINWLNKRLENESPEPSLMKNFKDFPISKKTLKGLKDSGYEVPTEIQRESIGLALKGLDILGAAKTGSGKTLAFLVPVIEKLYRSLWSKTDGLGAVVITPTRELAYQIFETLRRLGRYHEFSAGLIIGGKDLKFERKRMDQLNIVICTPGRLLQHMDESSVFDTSNLQVLVLDEADRCLDMGFEKDIDAIIEHLPIERQTLLYSATQTKSVKDLARLSLKSPVYVSVHENAEFSTPEALQQSYVVCPLDSKLNMLWSFLKHHRKSKIMVFMSSCKQVRFVNLLFCRMRPGISLLALHGSMHQLKRMAVYDEFCKKQAVVLFATDIAARGLDFPEVDWVLQLDCPEDTTTYIHRAGRTARFNKEGEALLVLLPTEEEAMLSQLQKRRIPIEKIEINVRKMLSVTRKFEALLARDLTLKECAQRAFKSYLKSTFLMKNKEVFDVNQLDLPSFARSLGLAVAPRVRFLQKRGALGQNQSGDGTDSGPEGTESDDEHLAKVMEPTKDSATFDFSTVDDDDDVDTLFTGKKTALVEGDEEDEDEFTLDLDEDHLNKKGKKVKTKASVAKTLLKKKIQINKKFEFDDDGEVVPDARRDKRSEVAKTYENEDAPGIDVEKAKLALKEEDQFDKQLFRQRVKAKHREERKKAKLARKGVKPEDEEEAADDDNEEDGPTLKTGDSDGSEDEYEPNLSWLPDPDKIYGAATGSDVSNNDEDDDNGSEEESDDFSDDDDDSEPRGNKRQREVVNTDSESSEEEEYEPPTKKTSNKNNQKGLPKRKLKDGLDGNLMEDLALQLLRGKR